MNVLIIYYLVDFIVDNARFLTLGGGWEGC